MDQAPPTALHLMFEDVWANRIAVSILQSLLGPDLMCHYANGNTALKAEGRQPVHSDIDKPHPLYPFAYAINIPLSDMNVENGSTELWPGSHRESNIDQHVTPIDDEFGLAIKPALVEQRRRTSPPVQPTDYASIRYPTQVVSSAFEGHTASEIEGACGQLESPQRARICGAVG
ncbi:hypothetical protein D0862_13423 [Hortaea werneckii]|uniref:Uncharacterized protein n=1 Tax=Hortaea werneckii TaxID=91943 RepID=A0A3M7ENU8_HORWE|nr:hypothetical protein D0862_13423 [Hortaea werneckii]